MISATKQIYYTAFAAPDEFLGACLIRASSHDEVQTLIKKFGCHPQEAPDGTVFCNTVEVEIEGHFSLDKFNRLLAPEEAKRLLVYMERL